MMNEETLTLLCAEADSLAKELSEKKAEIERLKKAIERALGFLACMDEISPDKPNEQLAFDVLNEALK
jgi:hypothetical protein